MQNVRVEIEHQKQRSEADLWVQWMTADHPLFNGNILK